MPKPSRRRIPSVYRPSTWRAYKQLLKHSSRPILVGPWKSELGFETLYWLPFLQRLREELNLDPERLIPISRGGGAAWYQVPGGFELYGMRTPQDVRIEMKIQHARTGLLKQTEVTPFDRQVLKDAAQTLSLKHYLTLHPAWMYRLLAPFWDGQRGLAWLMQHVKFGPALAPAIPEGMQLPQEFVAVRFYARSTFPLAPQLHQFANETIKQIARTTPVIVLNANLFLDDHVDFQPPSHPNVYRLNELTTLTPQNNLAVQSAVLARAVGFVGTYGGLAQLALRYGKPVVSLYHEWVGTALAHKHLSEALAVQMGRPFHVVRIGDLALLQSVLPQVIVKPATNSVAPQTPAVVG